MFYFEIRVTNTGDSSDFATTDYITQEKETTADDIMERVHQAINSQHDLEFRDGKRFITISAAGDDEGYMYTIYESKEDYDNGEGEIDGGQCTGTLSDAVEMALN